MFFVPAPYHIETGEAERIAVDHTSKPPEDGEGEASASEFLLLPKSFPFLLFLSSGSSSLGKLPIPFF